MYIYPFAVLISRDLLTFVFVWKASDYATFSILAAFVRALSSAANRFAVEPRPLPPPWLTLCACLPTCLPACIHVIAVLPEHEKIAAFVPGCRHAGAAAAPGCGQHTQLARNYYHRCGRCTPLPPFPPAPPLLACNWNWGRPKRRCCAQLECLISPNVTTHASFGLQMSSDKCANYVCSAGVCVQCVCV